MDWSQFFGGLGGGLGGLLSGGLNLLGQRQTQNIQNRWQSNENEKNRQFQADEAMKAREWQEDFYQQYQSPEAQLASQMAGYKAQGINPALMFGGSSPSGGSVPSVSTPQGSSNGSGTTGGNAFSNLTNDIAQGFAVAEQLMGEQHRYRILENQAKMSAYQETIARLDANQRQYFDTEIRNMFQRQYNRDAEQYEIDIKKMRHEKQQLDYLNQNSTIKGYEDKTNLEVQMIQDFNASIARSSSDISKAKLDKLEQEFVSKTQTLREEILQNKKSISDAEKEYQVYKLNFLKENGFELSTEPQTALFSRLFSVDSNGDITNYSDFDSKLQSSDEQSGITGWEVLQALLCFVPGVGILKFGGPLMKAGAKIFGKTFTKLVQISTKLSKITKNKYRARLYEKGKTDKFIWENPNL